MFRAFRVFRGPSNPATGKELRRRSTEAAARISLETVVFVYSGGKLVAEYSTKAPTSPKIKYLTEDHLGTPRIITNGLGAVESRRDFLPFGEEIGSTVGARNGSGFGYTPNGDDVRQKFTGYQKDEESQLDFAEARMYEPTGTPDSPPSIHFLLQVSQGIPRRLIGMST